MPDLWCDACNGGRVREFEQAVKAAGRMPVDHAKDEYAMTVSKVPLSVLASARTFLHTAHSLINGNIFACVSCGAFRKYGASES